MVWSIHSVGPPPAFILGREGHLLAHDYGAKMLVALTNIMCLTSGGLRFRKE